MFVHITILTGCVASARISKDLWPRLEQQAELAPGAVGIRWLGAAGFVLRADDAVLMVDPFISRPPLPVLFFGRLGSDEDAIALLPKPSLIAVGHAHYDHVMDVAEIARQSNARVVGSPSVCRVMSAMRSTADCEVADGRTRESLGPLRLRAIRSSHARSERDRVPLDGEISLPLRGEHPHVTELRSGGVIAWVIEAEGMRILHLGSAGLPSAEDLARVGRIDVVLAAAPIRTDDVEPFAKELARRIAPSLVIVHHHDSVFKRLTDPVMYRARSAFFSMASALHPVRARGLPPFTELKLTKVDGVVSLSE